MQDLQLDINKANCWSTMIIIDEPLFPISTDFVTLTKHVLKAGIQLKQVDSGSDEHIRLEKLFCLLLGLEEELHPAYWSWMLKATREEQYDYAIEMFVRHITEADSENFDRETTALKMLQAMVMEN